MSKNKNVVQYGSHGDKFFLVISGVLSVQVPNAQIKRFEWARNEYNKLKDWFQNVFLPRMQDIMIDDFREAKHNLDEKFEEKMKTLLTNKTGDSENKTSAAKEITKYEQYLARFQRLYTFNYLE